MIPGLESTNTATFFFYGTFCMIDSRTRLYGHGRVVSSPTFYTIAYQYSTDTDKFKRGQTNKSKFVCTVTIDATDTVVYDFWQDIPHSLLLEFSFFRQRFLEFHAAAEDSKRCFCFRDGKIGLAFFT